MLVTSLPRPRNCSFEEHALVNRNIWTYFWLAFDNFKFVIKQQTLYSESPYNLVPNDVFVSKCIVWLMIWLWCWCFNFLQLHIFIWKLYRKLATESLLFNIILYSIFPFLSVIRLSVLPLADVDEVVQKKYRLWLTKL